MRSFAGLGDLNESQQSAVVSIAADIKGLPLIPRIALLHGPPGTGKTQTIIALLRQVSVCFLLEPLQKSSYSVM